jgi:hypothetical protein
VSFAGRRFAVLDELSNQTFSTIGSWVRFFLEAVEASASESIRRAESLLQLREDYRRRLQGGQANAALLALVDGLFLL